MKYKWFTQCDECDVTYVVQSDHPLHDPDDADVIDETLDCLYCGRWLRGWSQE